MGGKARQTIPLFGLVWFNGMVWGFVAWAFHTKELHEFNGPWVTLVMAVAHTVFVVHRYKKKEEG